MVWCLHFPQRWLLWKLFSLSMCHVVCIDIMVGFQSNGFCCHYSKLFNFHYEPQQMFKLGHISNSDWHFCFHVNIFNTSPYVWEKWTGLRGRCLWSARGLRANDAVITRVKRAFWRNHSPWARGCFTNNAQTARLLFPLWHETRKFSVFSLKIVPHSSRWTWRRGHVVQGNSIEHCHPIRIQITAIAQMVLD